MRNGLLALALVVFATPVARAWDNHDVLTRLAVQSYENWGEVPYEPIDAVLSSLGTSEDPAPASLDELATKLGIKKDKVVWDWKPNESDEMRDAVEILVRGSVEADNGMDQDLDVYADQKTMGGTKGPSSQGFRHMYYRAWSALEPLATFHLPAHEMGLAPERAQTFFNLAVRAKKAGHPFWAFRFLGFGVHYVEDIGQPFHANQLGSIRLFPLWTLLTRGWESGVAEATRLSGNFHLTFEHYTAYLIEQDPTLALAFKVPKGDNDMKAALEQNNELSIDDGVKLLAASSSRIAGDVVSAEQELIGKELRAPGMDIISGFNDAKGNPKVDFASIEADPKLEQARKRMHEVMFTALSNTGTAIRWYVDRYRAAK